MFCTKWNLLSVKNKDRVKDRHWLSASGLLLYSSFQPLTFDPPCFSVSPLRNSGTFHSCGKLLDPSTWWKTKSIQFMLHLHICLAELCHMAQCRYLSCINVVISLKWMRGLYFDALLLSSIKKQVHYCAEPDPYFRCGCVILGSCTATVAHTYNFKFN